MPKSKDLVPTMRVKLCELRDIGWSYRKIHEKYPDPDFNNSLYN